MTSSTWVLSATCKLLWLRNLLKELGFARDAPMVLYFDNISTLYRVFKSPTYQEHTNHIEVDCHFIREKWKESNTTRVYMYGRSSGRFFF